eukprot:m.168475 g.168475  ORF g.168475 m.168475 type:complete len:70 (-) comp14478_c0_seq2:27-236(-)
MPLGFKVSHALAAVFAYKGCIEILSIADSIKQSNEQAAVFGVMELGMVIQIWVLVHASTNQSMTLMGVA